MFAKSIGAIPGQGRTKEDIARGRRQFEQLTKLVPVRLARKLARAVESEITEQLTSSDKVLFPGLDLEELGPDASPEAARLMKEVAGKRFCDLRKATRKEMRAALDENTDDIIHAIAHSWVSALWVLTGEGKDHVIRLDDRLLPKEQHKEILEELVTVGSKHESWFGFILYTLRPHVTENQEAKAVELYDAFIANLKRKVPSSRRVCVVATDVVHDLALGQDGAGYFIRVIPRG